MIRDLEGRRAGQLPTATSVLVVSAHPDDESFGLGGALGAFADAGALTSVVCFTRGEASTLGEDLESLAHVRSAELSRAAAELGVGHIELFEYPDLALADQALDVLATQVRQVASEFVPTSCSSSTREGLPVTLTINGRPKPPWRLPTQPVYACWPGL